MVLMLRGISGSGKSTWARTFCAQNPHFIRINRDDLRSMMCARFEEHEHMMLQVRKVIALQVLMMGYSVVLDDTNLEKFHENQARDIARVMDHEFDMITFDIPVELCIARDAEREYPVGEEVIRRQYALLHP
jgi:predicted kinase